MKTPSFFELKTIVEYLQDELIGAQLQEVMSAEAGLVLTLYRFDRSPHLRYLVFDLDPVFPFLLVLDENPWARLKKTKPMALFLTSNAKNQTLKSLRISEELGRVLQFEFGENEFKTKLEFRLIPKQLNLIAEHAKKSISWLPVKTLGVNDRQYTAAGEDEIRSIAFLTQQWVRRRLGGVTPESRPGGALSPYDKWLKQRRKDMEKKQKAIEGVQTQIAKMQGEEWAEVGEFLKIHGLKRLKTEWSIYVDFTKSASDNIQRCFEKAKAAKNKIKGARERLQVLKNEISESSDLSEAKFFASLKTHEKRQNAAPVRKVEGRLRKLELGDTGLVAYMGKSAADNMTLLRHSKPHDLWFHLKDYPSAHAILHRQKNLNLADSDLHKLGRWLIEEGLSAKQNNLGGKYAVVMVECRYVKPLKGDKMGRVTYHNAREILIAL